MTNGYRFDEVSARQLEILYSVPKLIARRQKTLDLLNLQPGETVLDIGFGPGYFAAEIAERIGPTGNVIDIDNSENMLALAEHTCRELQQVDLHINDAISLPLDDETVDAAIAVQVYVYVAGISNALAELHRVLKPGGRAIIADMDWEALIWHTSDAAQMSRFKTVIYEHFAHPYLPRLLPKLLRDSGFTIKAVDAIVMLNTEIDPYVMGLTKLLGRFMIGRHGITSEDIAAWEADLNQLNQNGEYFFSANQYLFVLEKA